MMVKDINVGAAGSVTAGGVRFFTLYNGKLYFPATTATYGPELWETDGTPAGTKVAVDLYGSAGLQPLELTVFNGMLYFTGSDSGIYVNAWEVFVTDGTTAGTRRVKDIRPGRDGSFPGGYTAYKGTLYFCAAEPVSGAELWTTDGTEAGTTLFKDMRPAADGSLPGGMVSYSDKMFLSAHRGDGREMFVSDGTVAGTFEMRPAGANRSHPLGGNIEKYTIANNALFFSAWYFDSTGTELWVLRDTTLTDTPTTTVKNVKPSPVFYTLAPNPADDVLQVTLNSSNADGHISITDMTGRRLFEKAVTTGEKVHTIHTANMPAGVYMFSYTAGGTTTSKRFVIQR
jgi:ELWxxDGT repeat protein